MTCRLSLRDFFFKFKRGGTSPRRSPKGWSESPNEKYFHSLAPSSLNSTPKTVIFLINITFEKYHITRSVIKISKNISYKTKAWSYPKISYHITGSVIQIQKNISYQNKPWSDPKISYHITVSMIKIRDFYIRSKIVWSMIFRYRDMYKTPTPAQ